MPIIILKGSKQRLVDPSKTTRNSGQLRRKKPGPFFWVTAVVEESWMAFIRNLISIKVFLGKPLRPNALHHSYPSAPEEISAGAKAATATTLCPGGARAVR